MEMRLLFCCEFYYPSVGGVQEVMRQLAERMVQHGHQVTVATSRLTDRTFGEFNGVRIEEFGVTGNAVRGMTGEIERYREFVLSLDVDAILIKAAQQWTFDALWPVLKQVHARKVFIPCGFSGLYQNAYRDYFQQLHGVLKSFDHLIFYATRYRDVEYVCSHGMDHFSIIPNGASEIEFALPRDQLFRARYNIPEDGFVFLTVGTLTGFKGHLEVTEAFAKLDTGGRPAVLILNGNVSVPPLVASGDGDGKPVAGCFSKVPVAAGVQNGELMKRLKWVIETWSARGWSGVAALTVQIIGRKVDRWLPKLTRHALLRFFSPLEYWIGKANSQFPLKRVLLVDLPRPELIQAYKNADLFVFASNVEYSPLVLFESAAAGTPFLSVPVGNAEEIAEWTGCGIILRAPIDKGGFTRANPRTLAAEMRKAMDSPQLLAELGREGYNRWQERYTWAKICLQYEKVLAGAYK
jgi:glycosyltransferase involved in cell wall biosynthesis